MARLPALHFPQERGLFAIVVRRLGRFNVRWMSLRNKLFADGVYTFAFRLANMAVAALLGIITARILGPHGRGIYALPLVAASLASAAFGGLNNATTYFMLREKAGRGVLRPALWCAGAFVAAAIPVVIAIAYTTHAPWAALPAILSLPAPAILAIFYGYQVGIDRVRMNTTYAVLNTLTLMAALLLAFAVFGRNPHAAVIGWVAGTDVFAAGALIWLLRHSRDMEATPISVRTYVGYAFRVGSVYLISLLNYRADVYIVASLGQPALLGMYTLAVTGAETLLAATQVTAVVSSPKIGSMENVDDAARLTARCVRNNVIVALVTCGSLWFVAPIAIRVLYGPAFVPMIPALRVLLIGVFALSLGSPMSTFFTIRLGKPQVPMLLAGVSAAICIAVTLLTIHQLGLVGAALGSTLGYIVGQGAAIVLFTRTSNLRLSSLLVPRWSDVTAYVYASGSLLRRLRRAA